jgi:hypothetical protein
MLQASNHLLHASLFIDHLYLKRWMMGYYFRILLISQQVHSKKKINIQPFKLKQLDCSVACERFGLS